MASRSGADTVCGRDDFGNRGKGSNASLADLGGQGRGIKRRINFEGDGLVVEVQGMGVRADAGVGMLGGVVIMQSGFGGLVRGHERQVLPAYS